MPLTRVFQPISLHLHETICLDEKASHHLFRVLRAEVNDKCILFNGQGGEFEAVISRIDKKKVEVKIQAFIDREAESPIEIFLAQGIARGEKMDFIVQKAVELGVTKIIPLITERSNVKLDQARSRARLAHWQSVIVSACEQSGRNRLPEILAPKTLSEWIGTVQADLCLVLSPHVKNKEIIAAKTQPKSFALLIGPEGGLSDQEVEMAQNAGFLSLNIGPRVLRTETATLAAVTFLQSKYGDMHDS